MTRVKLSPPRPVPPAKAKDRPNRLPLGDYAEQMFKKAGITEEWYKAAKAALGMPPTCSCPQRKAWLNRAGQWIADQLLQEQNNG
jgi:hypothetical protein